MPTTTKTDLDLRFLYELKRNQYTGDDATHFIARVVYVNNDGVLNPMDSDWDTAQFADLGLTAYHRHGSGWYGFEVEYLQPFRVDLRQAERMVKLLRKVHKTLDRLNEQFGAANDLTTYCARVSQAIGCKTSYRFGRRTEDMRPDGTYYRWLDVDGLRGVLDEVAASA